MEDPWESGFLGRREKPNIKQIVKKTFKKSQKSEKSDFFSYWKWSKMH